MTIVAVVVTTFLLFGGCSTSGGKPPIETPTLPPAPTAKPTTHVDWEKYPPSIKQHIDDLADAKNCALLQTQFDSASGGAVRQRPKASGQDKSDLMEYIDDQLENAGCKE